MTQLATIVRRQDFTDDLFVLWLRPQFAVTFRAGQYITIGVRGVERIDHYFYVLHGASFADEFVYDRELQRLSAEDPLFIQHVASVSRPSAERNARWRGTVGRVNDILEQQLTRWSPPKNDTVIYLCGHPAMIGDAERRLVPQGWAIAQEQYWVPRARQPAAAGA